MIGLIAIRGEAKALLKYINTNSTTEQSRARLHQGYLAHRPVILAEVSLGKVHTAAITQHLIDRYQIKLMISCGSAGSLSPHLQVGDVILADSVVLHDFGIHTESDFQHLGFYNHHHPDGLHYLRALPADSTLLATARHAAEDIKWPQIHTGCLASGDQIIAGNNKKQWLQHTFNALAVDMESAAMAQVAWLNEIPWLAVRAISDQADSTLNIDLSNFITISDKPGKNQSTLRKVVAIAQKPGQIKTAFKIRRAVQRAAANAAIVTAAIITQFD